MQVEGNFYMQFEIKIVLEQAQDERIQRMEIFLDIELNHQSEGRNADERCKITSQTGGRERAEGKYYKTFESKLMVRKIL